MSSIPTILVEARESGHSGPTLAVSDVSQRSFLGPGENSAEEDAEQTPASSEPLPTLVHIETHESDHLGRAPAVVDTAHPDLGRDGGGEEVKQTPASSAPLLSSSQGGRVFSSLVFICHWTSVFFIPSIAVAYLAFCYVVHYRVVPANVSGLTTDAKTQFLTNVGSVITTINIIIISLALLPLKGLLSELQSEEFFRLLSAKKNSHGVELNAINGISNPSYGFIESIMVVINRHCSLHYLMAFIGAVFVWAVSTLAPAALTIQPILIDGPVMAFPVGAIPPLSLYQPVAGEQTLSPSTFIPEPGYAAAVVWAEREIGLSYAFSVSDDPQGVYSAFAVPIPSMLNSTVSARWLTDVIGFSPYCTWAKPMNLSATSLNVTMNSTNVPNTAVTVHLKGLDLQVDVPSSYFPTYTSFFISSVNVHDPTVTVTNYTTGSLPTDGSMVMSVIQCASTNCTRKAIDIVALFVDFTDIPSLRFSSVGADYDIGFLVCKPNITIETREIRTQGSMRLGVQPLAAGASPYPRQGNLDWTQTSLITSYSLSALTSDSGPSTSAWNGLGSGTQADFMFGKDQIESIPTGVAYENTTMVLKPLSTDELAKEYTEMLKASMKPYLSGALGTSYVPGRVASVQQIFVSSLPHVIASTVLVVLLHSMAVVAHFRKGKGDQFNLTNVAAALAESELPQMAKSAKIDVVAHGWANGGRRRWMGNNVGQELARQLGDWKVFLVSSAEADDTETLHVSRE